MEENWNLGTAPSVCSACGKEVPPGQEMVSTLVFNGIEMERKDYCHDCFENVRREDLYSFWRATVAEKTEKPRQKTVDASVIEDLFKRMLEEKDPAKEPLLFMLAMILDRKRVIRYRGTRQEEGRRMAVFGRPRSPKTFTIPYPDIEPERLEAMREDLKKILDAD